MFGFYTVSLNEHTEIIDILNWWYKASRSVNIIRKRMIDTMQIRSSKKRRVQQIQMRNIMKLVWRINFDSNMMTSSNGNIFRVAGHLCGESTGPGDFPAQRPVTRRFDVNFDLRLNERFS